MWDASGTVEVSTRTLERRLTGVKQLDRTTRYVGIRDKEIKAEAIGEQAADEHNKFMVMSTTSSIKARRTTST
ncbi:hypothetical protein FF1_000128 [Malus domestica]